MRIVLAICLVIGAGVLVGCGSGSDADLSKQPDAKMGSAPTGGANGGAMAPSTTVETPTKVGG